MKDLYALIRKKKLTTPEQIFNFCNKNDFVEILETSMEAFAITSKPEKEPPFSLFNFSASLTLSGADYPCETLTCRIKKVADLAKFSALYSNRTTIYNPFDFVYFYLNPKGGQNITEEKFRYESINAFLIALEFKPLIERGLMVFSKPLYVICSNCKKKKDKMMKQIERNLYSISKEELFPLMRSKLELEYGRKSFHLQGIKSLIGDDMYIHYKKFPRFLTYKGKKINNFTELKYKNPLVQMVIEKAVNSLLFQKMDNVEGITQTYLTSNVLEKTLLEKMGKQAEDKALSLFAEGLPLIRDTSYETLLKTRDAYSDEFNSFQDHVSELINRAKGFETQEEFNKFVNNKLQSELKDLKKIQREAKKKFTIRSFTEGAFLGAEIFISSISNNAVPQIFSLAKSIYECTKLFSEANDIEKKIQKSPLYFYYKLSS